ncbi:MAG: hypothetical protein IPG44_10770 [Anaerolineales bacterium]|nr:hypothetical protein [Anaerolineales bacterium]
MTDEILYGLMEVFKLANNQYLKLSEITHRMQDIGFYQNVEFAKARIDLYVYYLKPPIFHESKKYKNKNWGRQWKVAHWLPRKENKPQDSTISLLPTGKETQRTTPPNKNGIILVHEQAITVSLLQVGEEIQRTISPSGTELNNGTIQLYGQDFDRFFASMDTHQQRQVSIDVNYYASEHDTCRIEQRNNDRWFLRSEWLKKWYLKPSLTRG